MMRRIYMIILIFFVFFSCENEKEIEGWLESYSKDFIGRKKIDLTGYKKGYSITRGKDYTHYVLTYYKVIDKDSSIVYFMRDERGDYFIETSRYFDIHVLGIPAEELE